MCTNELKFKHAAARLWKAQLNAFSQEQVQLIRRVLKIFLEQSDKGSESRQLILNAYKHFPRPSATNGRDMEVIFHCMSSAPKLLEEMDHSSASAEEAGRICSLISAYFSIN